jgi:hypothetical protein
MTVIGYGTDALLSLSEARRLSDNDAAAKESGRALIQWSDLHPHANTAWVTGPDDVVYLIGSDLQVQRGGVTPYFEDSDGYVVGKERMVVAALQKVSLEAIAKWDDLRVDLVQLGQDQAAAQQAVVVEFVGRKQRKYPVAKVPGTILKDGVHLPTLKDALARFGINVTQSGAGRVLVSSPAGSSSLRRQADRYVDVACRYGELLVSKKTGCDVPRCMRAGEWVTDSGGLICGKHAGQ